MGIALAERTDDRRLVLLNNTARPVAGAGEPGDLGADHGAEALLFVVPPLSGNFGCLACRD